MGFLSSMYLWLLPLSTLPLLIHLFYNRKFKTVNFSSIKFLKILKIDTIRKVRIIEILLLVIRTLIVLFIILMLSKPVMKSKSFSSLTSNNPMVCVIALDDSFSMTKSKKIISINDFYSDDINKIIRTLPLNSKINIVSLTDTTTLYSGLMNNFNNKVSGKMKSTYSDYSLLSDYLDNFSSEFNKEVHIFSDLQESSFRNVDINQSEDWNVFIHDLSTSENNISIISAKIINEIPTINKEIEIEVLVQNDSPENIKNALLILNIDNMNIGQHQFDLSGFEVKTYRFKTILTSPGEHVCSFELIYDNLFGDNFYYFPIRINSDINIGILSNSNTDHYFLESALKALSDSNKEISYNFKSTLINDQSMIVENDINFIFGYDFISNNNIESSIIDHFNNAGDTYIFPSKDENIKSTDNDFFEFLSYDQNTVHWVEYDSTSFYNVSEKNIYSSTINNLFIPTAKNTADPFFKIFKHFQFSDYKNPVILIDGKSAWEKIESQGGSINLLGFNFNLNWTNLPMKASFISFIDLLINMSIYSEIKLYESGDYLKQDNKEKIIKTPDNKIFIINNNSDPFMFSNPGIYSTKENQKSLNMYVNPPYIELLYNKVDFKTMRDLYENVYIVQNEKNLEDYIKTSRIGVELWRYFLYMAILLIIIEMVISNQFFRRI